MPVTGQFKNARSLRASLQHLVEHYEGNVSFTQGAAEELATQATQKIFARYSRAGLSAGLAEAEKSLPDLARKIAADHSGAITKGELRRMRRQRKFCGVSPWC